MGKTDKDIKLLIDFIKVYCRENHKGIPKETIPPYNVPLCSDCWELALYAEKRRKYCPKIPKPACKKCDTPCYAPKYKEKIRKIMKFSGIYYIKRGRLDYLYHYLK
ncbi:MAG: nitrous oxide-stimulated promoter family protein [Bacillota bacterium]